MTRNILMVGISALAFAASAASAQTTTTNGDTTDSTTGNRVVVSCIAGNDCSVTQTAGSTFNSTGSVNAQSGVQNSSSVTQTGVRQFAESRANGDRNSATVTQNGFANSSMVSQTSNITGTTTTPVKVNTAVVTQGVAGGNVGNNNFAQIAQVRTSGANAAAGYNSATVTQSTVVGGSNNSAVTNQTGTALTSTISQGAAAGDTIAAINNSATVVQTSAGASSTVTQTRSGNVASVSMFGGNNTANTAPAAVTGANISTVTQGNTGFQSNGSGGFTANAPTTANSPSTGNLVTVSLTGTQNNSTVSQDGVQNTVDQTMLNGGTGNTSAANATGTNPGTGAAFPTNRPEGNSSTITQTGRGNYAATSIGGQVTTGGGKGNISTITQSQSDAAVTATTLNSTQTASTAHRALAYQRGILDQVTISQSNNALGGAAGTATQSGSLADVAQLSFNSNTSISQSGTNIARVTQGARTDTAGANNAITIQQNDAGDITSTSGNGGFGGGTTGGSSRNFAEVSQYGIENRTLAIQTAVNASASIFQAVGTRNNDVEVRQGTGTNPSGVSTEQIVASGNLANFSANARNIVATVNQTGGGSGMGGQSGSNTAAAAGAGALSRGVYTRQSGQNLTVRIDQQGGTVSAGTGTQTYSNNAATITQAYSNSSATATQNGTNLSVAVEQRGINADTTRLNLVTINQSGDNNAARAVQTRNVGASIAGDATAGVPNDVNFPNSRSGANSAEIAILQSGTGGSATVEQRGKGQYASITQSGADNTAGILQEENATNAVAILAQSGSGNTYYVDQTVAGQYIRVNQTGTNNSVTQIVNGPGGASGGQGQTRPTFGGVQ